MEVTDHIVMLFTSKTHAIIVPVTVFDSTSDAKLFADKAASRRLDQAAADYDDPSTVATWPPAPLPTVPSLGVPGLARLTGGVILRAQQVFDRTTLYVSPNFFCWQRFAGLYIVLAFWFYFMSAFVGSLTHRASMMPIFFIEYFVLIPMGPILSYVLVNRFIRKSYAKLDAHATISADEHALIVVSPWMTINSPVASLGSVHRLLGNVVVFTDPFTAFLVPDREFGSKADSKRFVKRMQAAMKAAQRRSDTKAVAA